MAPDVETDWLEAFVWLQEIGDSWQSPSIQQLSDLFQAGITFESPDPFILGGNWIWCGDLANFDSIYCFDLISGYMVNRIATWNALEYVSGFRALAVRPMEN